MFAPPPLKLNSNTSSSNLCITRSQSQLTLNNNQIQRQQQFFLINHQSSFTSRKNPFSSSQVLVVPSSCTLVFAHSPSSQPSSQCQRQRCYISIIPIFTFISITIIIIITFFAVLDTKVFSLRSEMKSLTCSFGC